MLEKIKKSKTLVLGLAGSGQAAVKALLKAGAFKIVANDRKELLILQSELAELAQHPRVKLVGGGHPLNLLHGISMIIKSPGIKPELPLLQEARKREIPVYSEIELAFRLSPVPLFGITGTNGKTTTVSLVGEIFRRQARGVHVAGNIGFPLCEAAMEALRGEIIVAELSSFQLEDIQDFRASVAAVLNIASDHLDYHGTIDRYIEAKKKILLNQGDDDWAVFNWDDPLLKTFEVHIKGKKLPFSRKGKPSPGVYVKEHKIFADDGRKKFMICPVEDVRIPGYHNLENALAAVAVSWAGGADPSSIAQGLKNFAGVPHRLEKVKIIKGVSFINDSKGTNTGATLNALRAVHGSKILIAGGLNKGSDLRPLVQEMKPLGVKGLVLLGETASHIASLAGEEGFLKVSVVPDLPAAVWEAFTFAGPGDTVLLSPACASWDMFKSFEERGEVFKSAVNSLKEALEGEKCPHGA
ncbi:MAG: UDP-N-acetylmuramoyl-L-alanine--D-glutamate ligase [Firmicutes bacterium]|nr:UDP-N-acetylmuramoyl-L-alanine--D-glutamate ligase [Bacillota bacterium]